MKRIIIISLLCVFLVTVFKLVADEFEEWNKTQQGEFDTYKRDQDKAFADFLKKQWESFELFKGESLYEKPKPEEVPVAEEKELPEAPDTKIVEEISVPENVFIQEEPEEKHFMEIAPTDEKADLIINYWGKPLRLNYTDDFRFKLTKPINYKEIAQFWYEASETKHEKLISQLQNYKKELELNDWGYCLLLNEIGRNITQNNDNVTKLFVWFMLSKSGFDTKVGYNKDTVYLMIRSNYNIYGVPYLKFGDNRYYVVSLGKEEKIKGSVYTYDGNYPEADSDISLSMKKTPNLNKHIVEKDLKFVYKNKKYILKIRYDENTPKYLANYPQTNLEVYFETPLSLDAYQSISKQLEPILVGKSQTEAVNILLRFVQTAFDYKTDGEQFGREKSLFTDETLFYPYSDCEDRSILFAFLVRNLLGLEVIGLDYPGHIATAVRFPNYIKGYAVKYKKNRYLICDPTYINANIGMVMPQLKGVRPKLIKI